MVVVFVREKSRNKIDEDILWLWMLSPILTFPGDVGAC